MLCFLKYPVRYVVALESSHYDFESNALSINAAFEAFKRCTESFKPYSLSLMYSGLSLAQIVRTLEKNRISKSSLTIGRITREIKEMVL